jgi:hypothetical protein
MTLPNNIEFGGQKLELTEIRPLSKNEQQLITKKPSWLKILEVLQIAIPIGIETYRVVKSIGGNPSNSDGFKVNEVPKEP